MTSQPQFNKWREYVEVHKFTGPTIKLLRLDPNLWAILDHEYNFLFTADINELAWRALEVQHPPQRERPRPHIHEQPVHSFNINVELDI